MSNLCRVLKVKVYVLKSCIQEKLFLRLYAGPIRNRTRGRSTSTIRDTSLFLRIQARPIHESIPEHLLVYKAPCRENARVQSRKPPCFKGSMRGQSAGPQIHASNPEHLPVFKAPLGADPEENAGTICASIRNTSLF